MDAAQRATFDALLDEVVAQLPAHVRQLTERVPVIVDDQPDAQLIAELDLGPDDLLAGLHTGRSLLERSHDDPPEPENVVRLFREPIVALARDSYDQAREETDPKRAATTLEHHIREQIRITLLHELGHHFGLEEDDLDALGYA